MKDLLDGIKASLLGDFKNLIEDDIVKIAKIDPLNVPPGIFLKDNEDLAEKASQINVSILQDFLYAKVVKLTNTISPVEY